MTVRNSYFDNSRMTIHLQDEVHILTPDTTLDITSEQCPMTYVRTRLALDRMTPGQTLLVLIRGDEPAQNVPKVAASQGHTVVSQELGSDGVTRLLIRRA